MNEYNLCMHTEKNHLSYTCNGAKISELTATIGQLVNILLFHLWSQSTNKNKIIYIHSSELQIINCNWVI